MPRKGSGEEGVKSKQRSKSDKARRSFELNGTYSSKHLRLRAAEAEASARLAALRAVVSGGDGRVELIQLRSVLSAFV